MKNDKSYAELIKKPEPPAVTKEELADAIKRYLASGGTIKQCPSAQPEEE